MLTWRSVSHYLNKAMASGLSQLPLSANGYKTATLVGDTAVAMARDVVQAFHENAMHHLLPPLNRLAASSSFAYHRLMETDAYIEAHLATHPRLQGHPAALALSRILSDRSPADEAGFPQITWDRFVAYRDQVPHLFQDGQETLDWLKKAVEISSQFAVPMERVRAIQAAADVLRTQIFTAAVTAPPDLWLLRQILSTHKKIGTLDFLLSGRELVVEEYARAHGWDARQLSIDLNLLVARGYLRKTLKGYARTMTDAAAVLEDVTVLPESYFDLVAELRRIGDGDASPDLVAKLTQWLDYPKPYQPVGGWCADLRSMDIGYRLVPVILALKASGRLKDSKEGQAFSLNGIPEKLASSIAQLLTEAGFLRSGKVTALGARAFERGPGVYGIIEAYHPYLNRHEELLKKTGTDRPHVERGRNIAASEAANTKSFLDAVSLGKKDAADFDYVAEHACGKANGLKVWVREVGGTNPGTQVPYIFVAADHEPTSVEAARREVTEGRLPAGTFVGQADISKPEEFAALLSERGYAPRKNRVLIIVGNGFHEVRLDDAGTIAVARSYREANASVAFSEESALSLEQILEAGWGTYHAGFLWCHETSGQRLHAPWLYEDAMPRQSWKEIFEEAGYRIAATKGTRRIFPCPLPPERNPNISVSFFCVPR